MPKLPDDLALGERPVPQSTRPLVGYKAGQAEAALAAAGNQSMAAAGAVLRQQKADHDRLESAYAESALLRGQIDAVSQLDNDQDYTTYARRYSESMAKVKAESSGLITDKNQRLLFEAQADTAITRGNAQVNEKARAKEKDYGQATLLETLDGNRNALLNAPDEATRSQILLATNDAIHGAVDRGYVAPDQAVRTRQSFLQNYATSRAEMLPPDEQIRLLKPVMPSTTGGTPQTTPGMVEGGNIDLTKRPVVKNADGSISTVRSMSANIDGKEVLIPTVSDDGRILSNDEAVAAYRQSGKHLGKFDSPEAATAYAKKLHGDQAAMYAASGPATADAAINHVIDKFEGTALVPQDGNKGASKFGINQTANPGVDVPNLTRQQAVEVYRKEYWDKIGADSLPENMRLAAFDTAVNFGVPAAKDMLAKAGGDPAKLAQLRKDRHAELVAADPKTYGQYEKAWADRDAAILGDLKPSAGQPYFPKTDSWVDFIPPEKRIELYRRNQVVLRSQIDQQAKDSVAMAAQGQADTPLTREDFRLAFDGSEGEKRYGEYADLRKTADGMYKAGTMTPAEQAAMLEASKPPAGEQFAERQKNYETLARSVAEVNKQRAEDPIAFAQARGLAPREPLDFGNPQNVPSQLQARSALAQTMHQDYGTPLKLLTADEAKRLSLALGEMPPASQLAFFKTFRDGLSDPRLYQSALQQVRPDSPVTAMAGMYLGLSGKTSTASNWLSPDDMVTPDTVAEHLVIGEALLNPAKTDKQADGKGKLFPMPGDGSETNPGLRDAFNSHVGDAFRGQPQAADQAYQAYKAYYAAAAAKKGDYSGTLNADLASAASKAVVGTVVEKNGRHAIAPWGMDETTFNDVAKVRLDDLTKAMGFDRVTYDDVALENTGEPNTYRAVVGSGYLLDAGGKPLTIRVP